MYADASAWRTSTATGYAIQCLPLFAIQNYRTQLAIGGLSPNFFCKQLFLKSAGSSRLGWLLVLSYFCGANQQNNLHEQAYQVSADLGIL